MAEQQAPQVQIKADEKELVGALQQSGDDSSQSGRVHAAFHLHFSQRHPREAGVEHDRQPGTRQAAVARAGREYRAVRGAVRADSRSAGARAADEYGFRAVGCARRAERCSKQTAGCYATCSDVAVRTSMPPISAILITFNEERDLPEALASLRGVADEIVVVDSGSTDRTCEIARQSGARVVAPSLHQFRRAKKFCGGAGGARLGAFP